MTYLIKYLGEFKFIFETILDYESGDQMGSFDVKNPPSKISCLGTFKMYVSWGAMYVICLFEARVLWTGPATRNIRTAVEVYIFSSFSLE